VSVGALLGIPPDTAQDLKPRTPLPLPARTLLLSLRDGAFQSTAALVEGVAAVVNAPAIYPKARRAVQIGVCALLPVVTPIVTIAAILSSGQKGLARLESPLGLLATALALGSGMLFVVVPFALLGAFAVRGGFTLRAFGAAVVNRHGEPASRFRTLWRAMVTWSPVVAIPFVFKNSGTDTAIDARALILQSLVVAPFVAGAVWTALHPSRSIQDRLAGTWIVPR
jgi:RDD family protein